MPLAPALLAVAVAGAALTGAALAVAPEVTPVAPPVPRPVAPPPAPPGGPAAPAAAAAPATPAGPPAPVPRSGRAFTWPLRPAPAVVRRFAVGPHRWSPGHRGVDLAGATHAPVLAAGAGVVSFAGAVAGRGVVSVRHAGGLRTTYEPVSSTVTAGDPVRAGDVLGALAPGGHCPRACLHWGALRGDVYLDPLTLLRPPGPVVLLPLGRVN